MRVNGWLTVVCLLGVGSIARPATGQCGGGQQKLLAADGSAGDDFGISVALDGPGAVIGSPGSDGDGTNRGAAYVYRPGTRWMQETRLVASDAEDADEFGIAVAVSGSVAVVGAVGDDDGGNRAGAAYVFRFDGATWIQEQKLLASDAAADDWFGWSVAVDGDRIAVAARFSDAGDLDTGAIYVFAFDGILWNERQKLVASTAAAGDELGFSLAMSGDVLVAGADMSDRVQTNSGAAYVFRWTVDTWVEEQELTASDAAASDQFGTAVACADDLLIVSASLSDATAFNGGAVYVFRFDGSTWQEHQRLTASDPADNDYFGSALALDEGVVLVGSPRDDDLGGSSGSAYLFRPDPLGGGLLTETRKLVAPDGEVGDLFGAAVSLSGDVMVAGAYREDESGSEAGAAYVLLVPPPLDPCTTHEAFELIAPGAGAFDEVGTAVAFDATYAVIAARRDDSAGANAGSVHVFENDAGEWKWVQELTASDAAVADEFGSSLSLSGDVLVVGAPGNDDQGSRSGAAYVFRRSGGRFLEEQKLLAPGGVADDLFGYSVAVDGDLVAVGAVFDDQVGLNAGAVYLMRFAAGSWGFEKKLTASDAEDRDELGATVALDGSTLFAGAPGDDDLGARAGAVYVFRDEGGSFVQRQKLFANSAAVADEFGSAVTLDLDTALTGSARADAPKLNSGRATVFRFDGNSWNFEQELTPRDGSASEAFGTSVALRSGQAAVGAPGRGGGAVFLYRFDGSAWQEEQTMTAAVPEASDGLGAAVALGEARVLVGAPGRDGSATNAGSALGFLIPELLLDVTPGDASPADVVTLTTCRGAPAAPLLLALVEVDQVPVFLPLFASSFDLRGRCQLLIQLPAALSPVELTLQSLGIASTGEFASSNPAPLIVN